ncbi:MAG: hypothetical protein JWO52_1158 [Gammaproteobacteria bacterium]|jgi:hypothetical protein|nr:hypothetical protein [Gammaproteobacteria bacterium]
MAKRSEEELQDMFRAPHHGSRSIHFIISHSDEDHLSALDSLKVRGIVEVHGLLLDRSSLAERFENPGLSGASIICVGDRKQFPPLTHAVRDAQAVARELRPPGARLTRITKFCLTAEAHRLIVWPAIMDMRLEYADARIAGDSWCATFILIRGYASVLLTWACGLIARGFKRMFST